MSLVSGDWDWNFPKQFHNGTHSPDSSSGQRNKRKSYATLPWNQRSRESHCNYGKIILKICVGVDDWSSEEKEDNAWIIKPRYSIFFFSKDSFHTGYAHSNLFAFYAISRLSHACVLSFIEEVSILVIFEQDHIWRF